MLKFFYIILFINKKNEKESFFTKKTCACALKIFYFLIYMFFLKYFFKFIRMSYLFINHNTLNPLYNLTYTNTKKNQRAITCVCVYIFSISSFIFMDKIIFTTYLLSSHFLLFKKKNTSRKIIQLHDVEVMHLG